MTTTTTNTANPASSQDQGAAHVADDPTPRIVVDSLHLTHPSVVAAARRWAHDNHTENVAPWVTRTVELGARAATLAAGSADLDSVRHEVRTLGTTLEATTGTLADKVAATVAAATTPGTGAIPATVAAELDRLTANLAGLLGDEAGPVRTAVARTLADAQARLVADIATHLGAHSEGIRQLVDPNSPTGPLAVLRREHAAALDRLASQVSDIGERLAAADATTAERARGPRKGEPYEAAVHHALGTIATAAGDHADAVGTTPGQLGTSKKGDTVVTVAPAGPVTARIVVEVKDERRSAASWTAYMAEARENRGAHVAVAVVPTPDQVPSGAAVEVLDDSTIVVAHTPGADDQGLLVAVYRLARARAIEAAAAAGDTTDGLDVAALAAAVASARRRLDDVAALARLANSSRKAATKVADAVAALGTTLAADLDAIATAASPDTTAEAA